MPELELTAYLDDVQARARVAGGKHLRCWDIIHQRRHLDAALDNLIAFTTARGAYEHCRCGGWAKETHECEAEARLRAAIAVVMNDA